MSTLLAWLVAHLAAVELIGHPGWVPSLTLLGLVRGVAAHPGRWFTLSTACGLFTALWALRHPVPLFLGYLALGWLLRSASDRWDTRDPSVELGLAAALSACLAFGLLWVEQAWSLATIGLALWQVAGACGLLMVVQRRGQRA
ncbi:MAG: hypothetical protein HY601_02435 [Candidatus Omnitrophica bacterium]|nr:hypothetical protein [Candidatus Omnitrophota bacterium]